MLLARKGGGTIEQDIKKKGTDRCLFPHLFASPVSSGSTALAPVSTSLHGIIIPVIVILVEQTLVTTSTALASIGMLLLQLCDGESLRLCDTLLKKHDRILVRGELFQFFVKSLLNALVHLDVILSDECDRFSRTTSAGCTTDTMDVVLGVVGKIVIENNVD